MKRNRAGIVYIIIIILIIVWAYMSHTPKPIEVIPVQDVTHNTVQTQDIPAQQFAPLTLTTKYISSTNWPPQVTSTAEKFTCTTGIISGIIDGPRPETQKKTIGGTPYCVTSESEGAMGSTYTTYTYAKADTSRTSKVNFTIRTVQCGNYDEPSATECKEERASFNPDSLIHELFTVDSYIKANIATIAKESPVLGGTWMATSVTIEPISNTADVTYEDGHIQGKVRIGYAIAGTQISITKVTSSK